MGLLMVIDGGILDEGSGLGKKRNRHEIRLGETGCGESLRDRDMLDRGGVPQGDKARRREDGLGQGGRLGGQMTILTFPETRWFEEASLTD